MSPVQADDVLYMKEDFPFALTVVKAGTKVVIDSGATTRKVIYSTN